MARRGAVFFGVVAGAALGWWLAEQHRARHREDLFSPRPLRRFAALGGLAGAATVDTVRVLRDYLEWERHPVLLRRARALVRRLEAALG
jgi:hypothetical protein